MENTTNSVVVLQADDGNTITDLNDTFLLAQSQTNP